MVDQKTDGNQNAVTNSKKLEESATVVPKEDVPPKGPAKEYAVDIFRDWCKGCGICAEFCPRGCIKMNEAGQPVVEKAERCTGCGWCELHCPDFAVCVRELAAKRAAEETD